MLTRIRHLASRLLAVFRGGAMDRDFAQELESHLEMMVEDNIRCGMSPAEARRRAAVRLGAASSLQSQHRDTRGFPAVEGLFQDGRFAARLILRERWVSAAAVAAIALGIGANTLGFTIINAAFIRPFAFERAEELHAISWRPTRGRRLPSSAVDLEDWRTQARSFRELGAASMGAINISDDRAAPEQTQGSSITANLFDVMRQRPLLGRTFAAGEDRRGAEPVVIIGYDIWRNRFDRDPNVVGRILRINGRPATIVGVMPEGMKFPDNSELWVPYIPTDAQLRREARMLSVFGRLADGVTKEQASAEIDGIAKRILAAAPELKKSAVGGQVETLKERFLNGAAPRMFVVIMAAVIFVLLIACANVANLVLAHGAGREREIAMRATLGASTGRIARQLLTENLLLALLGGLFGIVLAAFGIRFLRLLNPGDLPRFERIELNWPVLAFAMVVSLATPLLFGLIPALRQASVKRHDMLRTGARASVGILHSRLREVIVVGQVALALALVVGAGLLLRSLMGLLRVDPGFRGDHVTTFSTHIWRWVRTEDQRRQFFARTLEEIATLPGVESTAAVSALPFHAVA
jgi:predicted permease